MRALVAASAVLGALAGAHPTTNRAVDAALAAAMAGFVTYASSRARRWSLVPMVALGVALAPTTALLALALVTAAILARTLQLGRRRRELGALVGALAAQVLLRLGDVGPYGTTALLVLLAVLPVLASAAAHAHRREREAVDRVALGIGAATLVALAMLGIALVGARADVARAIDLAEDGLVLAEAGDTAEAAAHLSAAQATFASVHDDLRAPWLLPARLLPGVAQNANAVAEVAAAGEDVARAALVVVESADLDALTVGEGSIDLDVLRGMQQPTAEAVDLLAQARREVRAIDRGWLVPPVTGRLRQFEDEVEEAIDQVGRLDDGLTVAPWLLGDDAPRRYLVLLTTPAESRGLGGFVGSYSVVTVHRGAVDLAEHGPIRDLEPRRDEPYELSGPAEFLARYGRYVPQVNLKNVTASPDFPTVAAVTRELVAQSPVGEVDGVVALDPFGIAALLALTGPVSIEGHPEPLTADNVVDFLLRDQYVLYTDVEERKDLLGEVAEELFRVITSTTLPSPGDVGDVLGPVVEHERLLFSVVDEAADAFLADLGLTGPFARPDGGDFFSVRSANAGPNKLDAYLERAITYDVEVDADGRLTADLTVELTNRGTTDLPYYVAGNGNAGPWDSKAPFGTNLSRLALYTPHRLVGVEVDGAPVGAEAQEELGWQVYLVPVEVSARATVRVTFRLVGAVDPALPLRIDHQPLAAPDHVTVRRPEGATTVELRADWVEGTQVSAE